MLDSKMSNKPEVLAFRREMAALCEICRSAPRFREFFREHERVLAAPSPPQKGSKKTKTSNVPRIYGLDCEMVITVESGDDSRGYSLARASLVELVSPGESQIVFDVFVKQDSDSKVLDYLEHVSGVTEQALKDAKHTLSDVVALLDQHVQELDIIVGHTLQSDFSALSWSHPRVIDTSVFFSVVGAPRFTLALKDLVAHVSGDSIHSGDVAHDPVQDAKYALQVAVHLCTRLPEPKVELEDVPERYKCLLSVFNFAVDDEVRINKEMTALAASLNGKLTKPIKVQSEGTSGKAVFEFPDAEMALKAFSAMTPDEAKNSHYGYLDQFGFRKKHVILRLGDTTTSCEISAYSRPVLIVVDSWRCPKDCVGRIMGVKGARIVHIRKICGVDILNNPVKDGKSVEMLVRGETKAAVQKAMEMVKRAAKGDTLGVQAPS